jgi:hypothetical protein
VCCALLACPSPAQAFNPIGTVCGIGGLVSGALGKACNLGGKLLGAGKKVAGAGSSALGSKAQAVAGLAAMGAWVLVGAKVALHETASVIAHTTAPRLTATWFSSTYWRMAAIGAVLTLPFLFAAAVQALLRSDLALLVRAALGYLPLALIAVGIASPLAMLLLAATDEICSVISSAAGDAGAHFLSHAGVLAGLLSLATGSPFLAFLAGLVAAFGALLLWIELLMREAAVYVVVLMLPIAFAALVWPARRIWAVRAVELLVALILSKFAIVSVLSLGGAALGQTAWSGITGMLAGGVLVILGAVAPWALIRLLPMAELASTAAGTLRGEASIQVTRVLDAANRGALEAHYGLANASVDADSMGEPAEEAARAETERLAGLPGLPPSSGGKNPAASEEPAGPAPPQPPPENPEPRPPAERSPGLSGEYQMPDFTWDLDLGPDAPWPPRVTPEPDAQPPENGPPQLPPPPELPEPPQLPEPPDGHL